MAEPADRLRQARERAGYPSAKAAAEAIGVPLATYTQHENGGRGLPAERAKRYARFFRTSPEWLLYGTGEAAGFTALGPQLFVKGEVAAGVWKDVWELAPDEWEAFTGRADISSPMRKRFGLRVVGPSMNAVYPEGTIIECIAHDGANMVPSGKRVVVQRWRDETEVETTVKELHRDDDGVEWLVPRSNNPAFQQPVRADQPEPGITRVEIVGVVVASIRPE